MKVTNARYYDPELGQFLSPDTLVPDPGNLFDYNRYMYTRGNPMRYNDPTGHQSCMAMAPAMPLVLGCQAGELAMRYGPTIMQLAVQWADKLPAVGDWLFSSNTADQGTHSAGQQNAGNTGDPGGLDPNDPFGLNKFTQLVRDRGFENLQRDLQSTNRGNRVGAERVTEVMNRLGDQVQRVGVKDRVPGVTTSDIDILDTAGNVHEVGAHTAAQLGMKFQYAQAWIAQSSNPNAQVFYWHFGDLTQDIIDTAQRWNVAVQVVK